MNQANQQLKKIFDIYGCCNFTVNCEIAMLQLTCVCVCDPIGMPSRAQLSSNVQQSWLSLVINQQQLACLHNWTEITMMTD